MRKYSVELTGKTPLLLHPDDLDWADRMKKWKEDPVAQKETPAVPGDDRTPAWRWVGNVLHDGEHMAVSSDMLMKCFMEGGAMVPVPGGKNGVTFKRQTQSGMSVLEPAWKIATPQGLIPISPVHALMSSNDFDEHKGKAMAMGFDLFVKRAKIGAAKHVRVRPRFRSWKVSGTLAVWDDKLTDRSLLDILVFAGEFKGIGDWRPSAPKSPGPHGRFSVEIQKV